MREANIAVDDDELTAMGIGELIELSRSAGIVDLEELACHGTGSIVKVVLEERFDEERLESLPYVDEWEHLASKRDGQVYLVAFSAPALPADLSDRADELVGTCEPTMDEDGTQLSFVGEQADIAAAIETYRDAGIRPELRRLQGYEGGDHPLDSLTDRQREIVSAARSMGYYEVPRQVSVDDIAADFDVDPSTIAEHLQRAERNLINDLF